MQALQCPLCGTSFIRKEHSLCCEKKHCYDIARNGTVNFVPQSKASAHYGKDSFKERAMVMEQGLYEPVTAALKTLLHKEQPGVILDAGCGEGYFVRTLSEQYPAMFYAFDLSKESIRLAARHRGPGVHYFVGDMTRIPIKDGAIDLLLNLFSPAHYAEFARVLRPDGLLVKVVPTADHLKEIREMIGAKPYSNEKILSHLQEQFGRFEVQHVQKTRLLSEQTRQALLAMTPLLQGVDRSAFPWDQLEQVTISADILTVRA